MSLPDDNSRWLKRGRQRFAVARVLRKPMTASEICHAARALSPRIQLRDVWFLLCQMAERGLTVPLNRRTHNGRLYSLTEDGRESVETAFGITILAPTAGVD